MKDHSKIWALQDAKAKFSELVRRAQSEGPQIVTLHGKPVVNVSAIAPTEDADEDTSGMAIVKALQACPYKDEFERIMQDRPRDYAVMRDVDLE